MPKSPDPSTSPKQPALSGDPGQATPRRLPQKILLWLAGLQTVLVALGVAFALVVSSRQDTAGRGMLSGLACFGVLYWLVFVLPALFIARRGLRLKLGFALLLVPDLLVAAAALVS